jgi:hypothetical protein
VLVEERSAAKKKREMEERRKEVDKKEGRFKKDQKEEKEPEKDHSPESGGGDGTQEATGEHLTPLTLFTPREITAPVFRRPAAST